MGFVRTVSDVVFVYLTICLDDAETVRDRVRDDRGREADKGLSLWRVLEIASDEKREGRTNSF
jgi:hypothetical protein